MIGISTIMVYDCSIDSQNIHLILSYMKLARFSYVMHFCADNHAYDQRDAFGTINDIHVIRLFTWCSIDGEPSFILCYDIHQSHNSSNWAISADSRSLYTNRMHVSPIPKFHNPFKKMRDCHMVPLEYQRQQRFWTIHGH